MTAFENVVRLDPTTGLGEVEGHELIRIELAYAWIMREVALLCVLLLSSCDALDRLTGPTRDCAAESKCSETLYPVQPLSPQAEQHELDEARREVSERLMKAITTTDPKVIYVACPFLVENSNFGRNVCAAGVTHHCCGTIKVMTFERERTAPLVRWEARNYFYIMNGRRDLAM